MSHAVLPQALKALDPVLTDRIVLSNQASEATHVHLSHHPHVDVSAQAESLHLTVHASQAQAPVLHIIFMADSAPLEKHLHITLDADANLDLMEWVIGSDRHPINVQVTTTLNPRASLRHTTLSDVARDTPLSIMRRAVLAEQANLLSTHAAFASALTHQEQHIHLKGYRAEATARLVALTDGTQEALFKTYIEHHAPDTTSLIEHYGVANAASTLLFEGASIIHKGMKRSRAHQANKGLVIGEQARLDANPLLLIDEYDVEAGHGAAIGRIDEQQLYYLMSRGLTRKSAERLIINGYLAPLKAVIADEALTGHIETLLESKTK
ncbi:MAG: SufD family Fe-S cluster assembly protein [Acholeplasmatales bacterium]|nr:MAG: SufD family Fe-S cluster assembly protein [Acholeplasmatales bacterium]